MSYDVRVEQAQSDPWRSSGGAPRRTATPAGTVATAGHLGDYAKLGTAHDAIAFCKQRGLKFAGPNCIIYGHWNDDPRLVTTDVFYLVDSIA